MSHTTLEMRNTYSLFGKVAPGDEFKYYGSPFRPGAPIHYEEFIPVDDVMERLFYWEAQNAKLRFYQPSTLDACDTIDEDGNPVLVHRDDSTNVTFHPETGKVFGTYKTDSIHQFGPWLLDNLAHLVTPDGLAVTSDVLGITSAGILRGGALAWVELGQGETYRTPEGVDFRSHLMAYSSHDSSAQTTYGLTSTLMVCGNKLHLARRDMTETGLKKSFRRSVRSMDQDRIEDAREAIGLILDDSKSLAAELRALCETTVTRRQFDGFLGEWAPMPEKEGRGQTMAQNKREKLDNLYRNDMRVAPWAGTVFGVLQATNTFDHHEATVRGEVSRGERNTLRTIEGDQAKSDARTLRLLDLVLSNS